MAELGLFGCIQTCALLQLLLSEPRTAALEMSGNYYDSLNAEPTATDRQIRRNFRQLAVNYHPDKNKSGNAEKVFREIVEAYQVLSNKEKRRLYDTLGHEGFLRHEASVQQEDGPHFADLFYDLEEIPFVVEPCFHWSFHQDEEDDSGHYSFQDPYFNYDFDNVFENVDDYYY